MNYSGFNAASTVQHFDDVSVNVDARIVSVDGRDVHLTRTEFDLLKVFVEHPRQALSRTEILSMVWGEAWFGDDHLVSVHISNLRQKIGDGQRHHKLISTIHGYGYRFDGVAASAYQRLSQLEAS